MNDFNRDCSFKFTIPRFEILFAAFVFDNNDNRIDRVIRIKQSDSAEIQDSLSKMNHVSLFIERRPIIVISNLIATNTRRVEQAL